jgi:hypothetical protein
VYPGSHYFTDFSATCMQDFYLWAFSSVIILQLLLVMSPKLFDIENFDRKVSFFLWQIQITIRNTIIGRALSEAVHLELLLDHISTVVQDLNRC